MKYKKKLLNLKSRQAWWDKLPASVQTSLNRPGSETK